MLSIKLDDLIYESQVINRNIDGLLLALSDLLDDCTEPLAKSKHDEKMALYSLVRNCKAIEALEETLKIKVHRQDALLAQLERANLKGGEDE